MKDNDSCHHKWGFPRTFILNVAYIDKSID